MKANSLQVSHCQTICFQLLTHDSSSHFFLAVHVGHLRKIWMTFNTQSIFRVAKGPTKNGTTGSFFGGVSTWGHWTSLGQNRNRDLLSFLANSGMETSTMSTRSTAVRWSDITELFDFAWDGRKFRKTAWMTHPKYSTTTYKAFLKFCHYRKFLLSFQFLGRKQPDDVGMQALFFFGIPFFLAGTSQANWGALTVATGKVTFLTWGILQVIWLLVSSQCILTSILPNWVVQLYHSFFLRLFQHTFGTHP